MRGVTFLIPAVNYDAGGLVVEREWFIPPAFQSFVAVLALQSGLVDVRSLERLTAENERKARETK